VLDLGFAINWDKPTETHITFKNDTLITGYRKSTGWAKSQWVFFAAIFSQSIQSMSLTDSVNALKDKSITGKEVKGTFTFEANDEPLLMKVGISSASEEGALQNIEDELQTWDFDAVVHEAQEIWEKELQKVQAELIEPSMDTIFYSALYHAFLAPNLFSDTDGSYKSLNHEVAQADGFDRYTVFSLWDTFRASHPLFTLLQPKRNQDFIQSILSFYKESGLLPVWALAGNETNTMTGYHAVPVLADAILKGMVEESKVEEMYKAMLKSASQDIRGTNFYREYGYIPADKDSWSVTKTLEYAYDDWCIAQVAQYLGQSADYDRFIERAYSYKELFDSETLFMRGKLSDGTWAEPFDPFYSEHGFEGMYIEGTAWQHSWFVPHDVQGLINLFGSEEAFVGHIDSTFNVSSKVTGENASMDISGLIGQYAHGNEPSHHIAYLYNYAGEPWKTQEKVRQIMTELYNTGPDALAGNDDCGQMSAWYIFSALGFYPVNPAEGIYVLGSPLVKSATINLEGNKAFKIEAKNNSTDRPYIQEVYLNGEKLEKSYISHGQIVQGGTLRFVMGKQPNKAWGSKPENYPPSMTAK
jgi:predicted alpha-1,2-mannosidase